MKQQREIERNKLIPAYQKCKERCELFGERCSGFQTYSKEPEKCIAFEPKER